MKDLEWRPYKKGEQPVVEEDQIYPLRWESMEQVCDAIDVLPPDDDYPPKTGYKHKHRRERVVTQSDRNASKKRISKRRKREKNRRKQVKLQRK